MNAQALTALLLALCLVSATTTAADSCNGKWSSYAPCQGGQRCKTWVQDYSVGGVGLQGGNANSGGNGSSGGGGGGGGGGGWGCSMVGLSSFSAEMQAILGASLYTQCAQSTISQFQQMNTGYTNMRRLQQDCPAFGTQECTTSGCSAQCEGTWSSYSSCMYNWETGTTQKCRTFLLDVGALDLNLNLNLGTSGNSNGGYGDWGDWFQDRRSLLDSDSACPLVECTEEGCEEQMKDCEGSFSDFGACMYDSEAHANKMCKVYTVTS